MIREIEITREELLARSPDLSEMERVRLDSRTWVYFSPKKKTAEQIKKQYYEKQKQTTKQQAKESLSDGWDWA